MKKTMHVIKLNLAAFLLVASSLSVRADEIDDHVKQVCTGLSIYFYNAGPKEDELDQEITTAIATNKDISTLIKRAQFIGAAHACGQNVAQSMNRLNSLSSAQFQRGSAKADRFTQIITCTEARYEKFGIARWATKELCPETKQYFDTYVVNEQPIVQR